MAKILLVEDDNNLREIYQARMQAEGYTVVTASDGEAALAIAAKEKPDLIISDVMMPKISGFEMLDILRNTEGLKETKVIMLTALGQAEDKTRADSLGADKYLVKSQVTLEDIVNTAKSLLGEGSEATSVASAATPAPAAAAPATPAPVGTPRPQPPVVQPAAAAPVSDTPAPNLTTSAASPIPSTPAEPAQAMPATATENPVAPATTPPSPEPPVANIPVAAPPSTQQSSPATPASAEPTTVAPAAPSKLEPETPLAQPTPTPQQSTLPTAPADAGATASSPTMPLPAPESAPAPAAVDDTAASAVPALATQPPAPQPAPTPTPPADASAIDDKVVTNAVEQLLADADKSFAESQTTDTPAPTPKKQTILPSQPPTPDKPDDTGAPQSASPHPEVTSISGDNVTVAGKKVIKPIEHADNTPSLDELLAKESDDEPTLAAPGATINQTSGPNPPQPGNSIMPKAAPGSSFDPNSISL